MQFAKDNPTWGYRKLATKFGVGKTQIQTIIKKKQEILEAYENNKRKGLKRQRSGKYAGGGGFGVVLSLRVLQYSSLWDDAPRESLNNS